jgi:hypothetical protein
MNNNLYQFLKANKVKADTLLDDTVSYLVATYKQSVDTFTYASSLGQLILVVKNLFSLVLFYIQDGITQSNFHTANRDVSIYGLSRLTGHNPVRGHSARAEISLRVKPNAQNNFSGNYIYIPNYSKVKCLNNGLFYIMDLGADDIVLDVTNTGSVRTKLLEGTLDYQSFTGNGKDNQSYEASAPSNRLMDDNFIIVTVNGEKYEQFSSLYDMPFGAKGVIVKTGITSGIDLFFGSSVNTVVPPQGSEIRVDYLLTSGAAGNKPDKDVIFEFVDTAFDINSEEVNLNDVVDSVVELPPDFGADGENPNTTKLLAPFISRNFIIHDTKSIRYFLGRMNFFSVIKIFKDITDNDNRFNVLLLPKITDRLAPGEDYFSVDVNKFLLGEQEKTRLVNMLDESGRKSANISINPIDPVIHRSVMVIMIEVFERMNGVIVRKTQVRKDVRDILSKYHLNNPRVNKIPHSDIVRILDEISYVDTVKVIFIAEKSEDIDSKGNLSVDERGIIIMRGGFTDNEGVVYADSYDPDGELLGSVNLDITFVESLQ